MAIVRSYPAEPLLVLTRGAIEAEMGRVEDPDCDDLGPHTCHALGFGGQAKDDVPMSSGACDHEGNARSTKLFARS